MEQKEERRDVYYKLSNIKNLKIIKDENVHSIDWNNNFELINKYYKERFGIEDLQKDDPDDFEMIDVVAYIQNDEILSLAIIYNIKPMELEIGAVSTAPEYRGKGYCTACVSYAAKKILERGMIASITTMSDNIAMRKVAENLQFVENRESSKNQRDCSVK